MDQRPGGTSLVTHIGLTGIPVTLVEYLTRVRWKGIHEEPRRTNECTVHDALVAARSLARSLAVPALLLRVRVRYCISAVSRMLDIMSCL